MAITPINQSQIRQPRESVIDKVLKGVQIANGVLGTAMELPMDLSKIKAQNMDTAYNKARILEMMPTDTTIARTVDVPGIGPVPIGQSPERRLQELQISKQSPATPDDVRRALLVPKINRTFGGSSEALSGFTHDEINSLIAHSRDQDEARIDSHRFYLETHGMPYVGQSVSSGYRKVEVSDGLGSWVLPDEFAQKLSDTYQKNAETNLKNFEADKKQVVDWASGEIVGGRGKQIVNTLGTQNIFINRLEDTIDGMTNGTLKRTPQQLAAIANDTVRILTGSQGGGVESQRESEYTSALSAFASKVQWLTAEPQKAATDGTIGEIKKFADILSNQNRTQMQKIGVAGATLHQDIWDHGDYGRGPNGQKLGTGRDLENRYYKAIMQGTGTAVPGAPQETNPGQGAVSDKTQALLKKYGGV